jgi:hypothetical protein
MTQTLAIVVTVGETIRLMREIDEVIELRAFQPSD